MKNYRVSVELSETGLLNFLDKNRPINVTIEVLTPEDDSPITAVAYVRKREPRKYHKASTAARKRKSKVVDVILGELGKGQTGAWKLKAVLREAGMSEHSLSTGLQILQKSGQIKRADNGEYHLVAKEAAE